MKKLICITIICCCCSHYLFAQDSSMMNDKSGKAQDTMMMKDTGNMMGSDTTGMMNHMGKMEDCVYMHDGKMMVMKGGSEMAMNDNMTMTDGTMVMKDGTVKMKNGTTKKLTNGECVYMSGKMSSMRMDGM